MCLHVSGGDRDPLPMLYILNVNNISTQSGKGDIPVLVKIYIKSVTIEHWDFDVDLHKFAPGLHRGEGEERLLMRLLLCACLWGLLVSDIEGSKSFV